MEHIVKTYILLLFSLLVSSIGYAQEENDIIYIQEGKWGVILCGERSPHPDPDCRGVFFGLSAMHERPHLIRSVMEGISFSQWECVEVFREMGVPIEDMMICGGGGRSPFWRQMLADMYGCSVSTVQSDQGGALGAAILAGVGAGIYSDLETACDALVRKKDSSEPNMAANGAYAKYFTLYKELYRTLFQSFKDLKNI